MIPSKTGGTRRQDYDPSPMEGTALDKHIILDAEPKGPLLGKHPILDALAAYNIICFLLNDQYSVGMRI
jgi:hypothetical protein